MKKAVSDDFIKLGLETKLFAYGPTKGTVCFLPYGYFLWSQIQKYLDQQFFQLGVQNVYFPSLIPYSFIAKEKEHLKGFDPEMFFIEHVGQKKLTEKLVLRPTSEVIFCHYFAQNINSYRHLPVLYNQWVNVFRWEQNPNPFLRNMEFLWNEGHTLHNSSADALLFCQKIFKIYQELFTNYLFIPTFVGQKSQKEKFAGAETTWALETILPDGQFLQLATVHYFHQNFTQKFKIKCLNRDNHFFYPYQTSWGCSTRVLAALIKIHSDHYGLVLPFQLAKTQIAILPIYTKKEEINAKIDSYCQILQTKLKALNFRLNKLEISKKNIGFFHYQHDKEGTPLKIEIGLKETNNQTITYKLRNHPNKNNLAFADFLVKIAKLREDFDQKLYQTAFQNQEKQKVVVTNFLTYQKLDKNKAFQVWFCNQLDCELKIKELTQTVSRVLWKEKEIGYCFRCQTKTTWKSFFGRSY